MGEGEPDHARMFEFSYYLTESYSAAMMFLGAVARAITKVNFGCYNTSNVMVVTVAVDASGSDAEKVVKVSLMPVGAKCCPMYAVDTDGTMAADDHGYYFMEAVVISLVVVGSDHDCAAAAP